MSKSLLLRPAAPLAVKSERKLALREREREYLSASKSPATKRAYAAGWKDFQNFCEAEDLTGLPASAETVGAYLTFLAADQSVSTLQVKLAAISFYHRGYGKPDPSGETHIRILMQGIRHALGVRPVKKAPITLDELRPIVETLPDSLRGRRDRALLLVGYAGAFRRSELGALVVADLTFTQKLTIRIRKSKTDQEGGGMVKVIPRLADPELCPVTALRTWLAAAAIASGPVYRGIDRWDHAGKARLSGSAIALIVKECALRAGMDPKLFAGHSLRSGFITTAAGAGVESRDIMAQTGHKSEAVMRGYIQDAGRGASAAVRAAFGHDDDEDPAKW